MAERHITIPDLDSGHELGPTASNGVQIYAKDGKLYAERQGEDAIELANLTSGETAVPTGTIITFGGATTPNGWLECNGAELGATYTGLEAVLDGIYGTGGSGRSLLPDLRGRAAIGLGDGGTGMTDRGQGDTGGVEAVTLAAASIPAHSHGVSNDSHSHGITESSHSHTVDSHNHSLSSHSHGGLTTYSFGTNNFDSSGYNNALDSVSSGSDSTDSAGGGTTGSSSTGTGNSHSGVSDNTDSAGTGMTIDNYGSSGSHDNMSPFLAVKQLIKT
jgi:microcystin-dependent protein